MLVKKIQNLSVVNKILLGQLFIILVVIGIFYILGDNVSAKSAVYGGFTAFIPNFYFARKVSQQRGQEVRKVVRNFYIGESGKLVITAMLFALIFQDPKIEIVAILTTYIAALTVFWFALLIRKY